MSDLESRSRIIATLMLVVASSWTGSIDEVIADSGRLTSLERNELRVAPDWLRNTDVTTSLPEELEIIGGQPSDDERVLALRMPKSNGEEALCSGLWLTRRAALTAAHCLCDEGALVNAMPKIAIAKQPTLTRSDVWVEASNFAVFPGWTCVGARRVSDLAIVFMGAEPAMVPKRQIERVTPNNAKLELSLSGVKVDRDYSLIPSIPELAASLNSPPKFLNVQGFGIDYRHQTGTRNEVDLHVTSFACTARTDRLRGCKPFYEMILGADRHDQGRRDSCGGDSGGPVFQRLADGTTVPVGITSRSVASLPWEPKRKCLNGGIYTHLGLPKVLAWFKENGLR
jgi:hypothetical protein